MKTVFDNRQCAHIWAQQSQPNGRSNNGNMFFENSTIYSYGYHFPIATFIDDNTVLINNDSYSVSTGKQQGYVRYAVNHHNRIYASTAVIKAYLFDRSFNDMAQMAAIIECQNTVNIKIQRAKQKKAARYKAADIQSARTAINECKNLFDQLETPYPAALLEMVDLVATDDFNTIIAADEERMKAEQEKRLKAEREKEEKQNALIAKYLHDWYLNAAHIDDHPDCYEARNAIHSAKKIYMRLSRSGDEIETSKGARFPIEHAKKAFSIVRRCKENENTWAKTAMTQEQIEKINIRLGHFSIDEIDAQGNVKAGCHFVEWDQIERLATILKIYP